MAVHISAAPVRTRRRGAWDGGPPDEGRRHGDPVPKAPPWARWLMGLALIPIGLATLAFG